VLYGDRCNQIKQVEYNKQDGYERGTVLIKTYLICNQTKSGSERKSVSRRPGCNNKMHDQCFHAAQVTVIREYNSMVEWWLIGQNRINICITVPLHSLRISQEVTKYWTRFYKPKIFSKIVTSISLFLVVTRLDTYS
jgi:hypothetical protein